MNLNEKCILNYLSNPDELNALTVIFQESIKESKQEQETNTTY